ncbi:Cmx/CmrA family chloramphenicol efflux MFS transporter [Streptomyces sp. NPDC058773]|uniref:Cmx/CmrA family chloramphenicol efflux MFS transporter n=1 Tax=Streptomyces sp. NPDC058773 TaxID=3346632 RepID=UPI003679017A
MPFVLYLLGLAVFAQGTSEFMLSGLVPDIARDLEISVSAAGALTSAFAVGMVVGAPLLTLLSLRWSRRRALLTFLVTFLLVHVLGAVTTGYGVLLATRIVAALANAGFLAVALATAASMVAPDAKGRATSVLLGGTTLACVAGVPAGALLGELWGWRSAFWAVALLSVPALVAILWSVPATPAPRSTGDRPRARVEVRALRSPRLVLLLLLGALVNGATFCSFTYLAPLATEVTGFGAGWVPVLLALFGLGACVGVGAAGRSADARPVRLLMAGGPALLAGWIVSALAAGSPVAVPVLLFVQGALSFAVGSTLVSQVLYTATGAPTLGGGFATAALNVGAALGPWCGGTALTAGLGYRAPLWVSALLTALALVLALVVAGLAHRTVRRGEVEGPRLPADGGAGGDAVPTP